MSVDRRKVWSSLSQFVAAFMLALPIAPFVKADDGRQPNVVLIVADDLGLQLGCYGDTVARTPHIDRFATGSTRFLRAHCTTASCSPSRSVLLTGQFNHANGQYGLAHADHHFAAFDTLKSLPVILSEAGYRTCSVGKVHVSPERMVHFDTYSNEGTQGSRNTVRMAANARAWIEEKSNKPFFLYFCPTDPHRSGPGQFANQPKNPDRYEGVTPVTFDPAKMSVPPWLPDSPEARAEWAEFYQSISRFDEGVGRLLDSLKELKHWDDTLILVLSDNGPPFPGAKTTLYEPGARLPLLVKLPGQKTVGRTSDALVSWVDITPTILDVCGVTPKPAPAFRPRENELKPLPGKPQPVTFQGRSFKAAVERERNPDFDEIYLSHSFHEVTMYYPMRGIISGRYKYLWNLASPLPFPFASDLYMSTTWQGVLQRKDSQYGVRSVKDYVFRATHELYDLEADPNETHNLADDPAHAARLKELQAKVRAWQERTRDPWVTKWEYE